MNKEMTLRRKDEIEIKKYYKKNQFEMQVIKKEIQGYEQNNNISNTIEFKIENNSNN